MPFTLVGVRSLSTAATTDPETFTMAVPTGTAVGDVLVLCFPVPEQYSTADARLTEHALWWGPAAFVGAYGVATDLDDVEFTSTGGFPGLTLLVALRGVSAGAAEPDGWSQGDPPYMIFSDTDGFTSAVVFVTGYDGSSLTLDDATDPAWTTSGSVDMNDSGYYSLRVFTWSGSSPVPELEVLEATGSAATYTAFWLFWPPGGQSTLRRRQIPRAGRVRQAPDGLRQRQRFV